MTPMEALLQATTATLSEQLDLDDKFIGIHKDHRPPPRSGQFYLAIHPLTFRGTVTDAHHGRDDMFGLGIGITQRTGEFPPDRMGMDGLFDGKAGVLHWMEQVQKVMARERYAIQRLANTLIPLDDPCHSGFMEPLKLQRGDILVKEASPSHFRMEKRKKTQDCKDFGLYAIMAYEGARWLESYTTETEEEEQPWGISVMAIGSTFEVNSPGPPDQPMPPPELIPWNVTFANRRFSYASGGYNAFSSDSDYAAIRDDSFNWEIVGVDGSRVDMSVPLNGAVLQDFMWDKQDNEFWLVTGTGSDQKLGRYSREQVEQESFDLPATLGGEVVSWRTGTGNGSEIMFLKGWTASSDYIQYFDRSGLLNRIRFADIPGTMPGEVRFGNSWMRDGYGLAMSITGARQAEIHFTDLSGSQLVQFQPGRNITHNAWDRERSLCGFTSPSDPSNLWDHHSTVGTDAPQARLDTITQAMFREALGDPTKFANANHADLRNNRAVISVQQFNDPYDYANDWTVMAWERNRLVNQFAGITLAKRGSGGTVDFQDNVLPGISPNGQYAIWHDGLTTRIATLDWGNP